MDMFCTYTISVNGTEVSRIKVPIKNNSRYYTNCKLSSETLPCAVKRTLKMVIV